jgi:spore photoproduct lyase
VQNSPLASRVLNRLGQLPVSLVEPGHDPEPGDQPGQVLQLKEYKGRFLRFCPGTSHYRCCGYRIIHIGENCPLNCSYCILKAYFQDPVLKVWANQDRLFEELAQEFEAHPNRLYRAGTGEFTDSLALEALTGMTSDLLSFLARYPNACLELKSKVVDLSWMQATARNDRVLPAWSFNAPEVVDQEEKGVATLEERLQAARECARAGFRVCLHFDPIIHFPGWQSGYARAVEMIGDYLRPEDIAYLSLGSFRCMPELKDVISRNWPESAYIVNEFVPGLDGKLRLLRPLRVEQFRFLVDRLRGIGLDRQLYFCMESDEVWEAVFGCTPHDLGGLANHLLKRAFGHDPT